MNDNRPFCHIGLSRRSSEYVRGIAILLIMLHNLCHIFPAVVSENEFTWNPALDRLFLAHLSTGHPLLVYDLLSFLGWYGVPVFVLLSGYGLTAKYGTSRTRLSRRRFMADSWRKLLLLMVPGVALFFLEELCHSGLPTSETARLFGGILVPLTGLNDLVQAWLPTVPGVYWYFGLTLELYAVYALIVHCRSLHPLILLTLFCYLLVAFWASLGRTSFTLHPAGMEITVRPEKVTEYLRHNFTGWLLPFSLGIMWARRKKIRRAAIAVIFALSLLLFLPLQTTALTWQAAALPGAVIIVGLAAVVMRVPALSRCIAFTGRLSPFLFVSHPVARHILGRYFMDFTSPSALPDLPTVAVYLLAAFATAICYRYVWKGLGWVVRKGRIAFPWSSE